MVRNQKIFGSKSIYLLILAIAVAALLTQQLSQQAYATVFGDLGNDLDKQGVSDGKQAALSRYLMASHLVG
jgi:hypothetical protein